MSLYVSLLIGGLGFCIGIIGPRLPNLFMTRTKGFNTHFPPHPEPIPLTPHLTQRIIHMKKYYHAGLLLAALIFGFGYVSLKYGSGPFGFGMWIGAGWFGLSRLQQLFLGDRGPWGGQLAEEIQVVKNSIEKTPCCETPQMSWHLKDIRCDRCHVVAKNILRPDLGRKQSDGFFRGAIRLLLTDGYPILRLSGLEEEE